MKMPSTQNATVLSTATRKRSVEPRPHPAKLLNKRYWDDVRAGRIRPPPSTKDNSPNCSSSLVPVKEEIDPIPQKKRRATSSNFHGVAQQSPQQSMKPPKTTTNSNLKNSNRILSASSASKIVPPPPAQPISVVGGIPPLLGGNLPSSAPSIGQSSAFPPSTPSLPQPPPLFRFGCPATLLPPPPPQFFAGPMPLCPAPPNPFLVGAPTTSATPMPMFPFAHPQQTHQPTTAAAMLALLEVLARSSSTTKSTPINQTQIPGNSRIPMVSFDTSTRNSDAQIDEMMDSIVRSRNRSHVEQKYVNDQPECDRSSDRNHRICILPIPIPVPIPLPVSIEFIIKHFGAKVAGKQVAMSENRKD